MLAVLPDGAADGAAAGGGVAGAPHQEPSPARVGTATLAAGAASETEGAGDGEAKKLKSEAAGESAMAGASASSARAPTMVVGEVERRCRGEWVGDELSRSGHSPPAFHVARGFVTTRVEEEAANWLAKSAEGMVEPLSARPGLQCGHLSP